MGRKTTKRKTYRGKRVYKTIRVERPDGVLEVYFGKPHRMKLGDKIVTVYSEEIGRRLIKKKRNKRR